MNKLHRLVRYDWPMHFTLFFTNWFPDNVLFLRLRGKLISPFFKKCGKNLRIGRNNVFYDSSSMTLGDNVYIAIGNWFNASGGITIGSEVMFGPKSLVVTSNHTRKNGSFRYGHSEIKPISIGFGSWIGGNCAILAGATVGRGCLVGANSVVIGDIPDNSFCAGNPAIIKKGIVD